MTQFTVYRSKNPLTGAKFPFLVDVQSDMLGGVNSRVAVPLTRANTCEHKPTRHLMPILEFAGEAYVLLTPDLSAVQRRDLGPVAGSLAERRDSIIAAIDFLVLGF